MILVSNFGPILGPSIEDVVDLSLVFKGFERFRENLSDVRTGRAFRGGERNAFLSSVLCIC